MIRETKRKVAGTAVTKIEANRMPCNKEYRDGCHDFLASIHLKVQVDAEQGEENCCWDCNCEQLHHGDHQPGQQETALEIKGL